jgi:hypothetical protein
MDTPALFDERDRCGFRRRFSHEARRARFADIAVTRIRLATIDLSEEELRGITRIRLVLSELMAPALDAEAHALMARPEARGRLVLLDSLLTRDRVRVRVAPLGGWSPDFTVFRDSGGPRAVLLGFHSFEHPHPYPGPALGAHFGAREAREAAARFEGIWARGHDVAPALRSIFRRARIGLSQEARPRTAQNPVDTLSALG